MKTSLIFYTGLAIDAIIMLLSISNILLMQNFVQGADVSPLEGLSATGRMALWLIPLLLAGLMGFAFWLKNSGKMLPANILLWIPALPMLAGLLLWGGLAVLFVVSSIFK